MRIYLVRHGETLFNIKGIKQGWCDSPLTDKGIEQAIQRGKTLENIDFEQAYSSTSERAVDTLSYILGNRNIPRKQLKSLKEANFGTLEGESEEYIHKTLGLTHEDMPKYGGESIEEVENRMISTLNELSLKHSGNVLAVTHGGIMIQLMNKLFPEEFKNFIGHGHPMPNCCVLVLDVNNKEIQFIERII